MNDELLIISGQIVPMSEDIEIAGFSSKDLMRIKAVALYEGINANNALFERAELEKSTGTFLNKPLYINPYNNKPTGHGYDSKTGSFSNNRRAIGFIHSARGVENADTGKYEVVVDMIVWEKYYPEIASAFRKLHINGDLKFSLEAEREQEFADNNVRVMRNINFTALVAVDNPAFENAKSLIVAELEKDKGGKEMEFEKLYNEEVAKNTEIAQSLEKEKESRENAEKELTAIKEELAENKEKLVTLEGEIKDISLERDNYKSTIEKAEKEKTGTARLAKLQKYGEVSKSIDELAEMTAEEFVGVLEEMVDNYKPVEVSEKDKDIVVVPHEKGKKTEDSRKEKLLSFIEGLK